jgi:hypothetical protein
MIKKTITIIIALALILAVPGIAMAQTTDTPTTTVDRIKERAQQAISHRLETIDRLRTDLNDGHATADHAATLLSDLDQAEAGLQALSAQIDTAGTADELRILVPEIATDFRISLVVAPKTLEVIAADTVQWAVDSPLTAAHDRLSAAIERAQNAGYDVSDAAAALQGMQVHMTQAEAHAGPVANQVIGLQASDWENPARALLEQGHEKVHQARDELAAARDSARAAFQALRDAVGA